MSFSPKFATYNVKILSFKQKSNQRNQPSSLPAFVFKLFQPTIALSRWDLMDQVGPGLVQTHSGLACSRATCCFRKGQSLSTPHTLPTDGSTDVIGSVWCCVSAHGLSASVYTYREIRPVHTVKVESQYITTPRHSFLLLHWSIGCERPWEKGVDARLHRRLVHIWLWSSKRKEKPVKAQRNQALCHFRFRKFYFCAAHRRCR